METILANKSVRLSELSANIDVVMQTAEVEPVAILNRNKAVGYLIGVAQWEAIAKELESIEGALQTTERLNRSS